VRLRYETSRHAKYEQQRSSNNSHKGLNKHMISRQLAFSTEESNMKFKKAVWLAFLILVLVPCAIAQNNAQTMKSDQQDTAPPATDTQKKNVQEYVELLRSNVRQEKAQIMGAVMQLSADDAAKFWPIYAEYNTELTKVNDQRVANIEEYARRYNQLTDEKADELVQNAMRYQKMRAELLAKYYDRVKQSLGVVTAARFLQVESQLLLIIDLQIAASLPLAGENS